MNTKGFSVLEVLISSTIGAIALMAYASSASSQARITASLTSKVAAENYAVGLNEVFRSMNSDEMHTFLRNIKEVAPGCPVIPGDFNRDGKVDNNDLPFWEWDKSHCAGYLNPIAMIEMRLPTSTIEMRPPTVVPRGSVVGENANRVPECTADANGDGKIDSADKIVWEANTGTNSACGAPNCAALPYDFNRDGLVDAADVTEYNANKSLKADINRDGVINSSDGFFFSYHVMRVPLSMRTAACGIPKERFLADPQAYRLCTWVNDPAKANSERWFYDPIADLPPNVMASMQRSFKVSVVRADTLAENSSKCIPNPTLSSQETYMVSTRVSWGSNEVSLSMLLPNDDPPRARIFASSRTYTGDLGGRANANDECQSLALSAGLPGAWVALLSPSANAPESDVDLSVLIPPLSGDVYDIPGNRISTKWDFWTATHERPILFDESGNDLSSSTVKTVWTGIKASTGGTTWTRASDNKRCEDGSGNIFVQSSGGQGHYGNLTSAFSSSWLASGNKTINCGQENRIYCIRP